MFYFLIAAFLLFYLTCHIISEFKIKAIKAGEADLSLLEKNKFFMCRTCKMCAITAFFVMLMTGFLLLFAPPGEIAYITSWDLLGLTKEGWKAIHVIISVLFIVTFTFHIYIHWGAALSGLKRLFGKK